MVEVNEYDKWVLNDDYMVMEKVVSQTEEG